ncbi:MAG: hypothetical protein K2O34_05915, partial [Acetatifactor sp.]|nr:hypothetical protein [Acetatifactor sp.]
MYECPGCGANMKFDIEYQQMSCAYCGRREAPESLHMGGDAQEDTFEATRFTCPQCGGEMISGDQDATAFCSFCGAANILTSRLVHEKRPGYIIPFKKTKEDCKKAYARKMRWALFTPKELRNPAHIDSFRGIYMPYWTYQLEQKGGVCFKGSKSYRKGDYVYTEHYDLTGDVDADYYGFSYDASSTFYDNISEALAPYYVKDQVEFTPAYLSGFYADIADVNQNLYLEHALALANESSWAQISGTKAFRKYKIDRDRNRSNLTDKLHTECTAAHSAMYPVWFLSWRKEDRVAYATVNGQTGKVVADLPIDIRQFIKMALVLAIPLFILLNLLGTMKPLLLLMFCSLLGVVTAGIYLWELRAIRRRESNEADAALWQKQAQKGTGVDGRCPERQSARKKKSSGNIWMTLNLIIQITVPVFACMYVGMIMDESASAFLPFAAMIACAVFYFKGYR